MNKKTHIRELAAGNIVIAEIVEPITDRHFIVNFDGALVRVENKSPVTLKRNQRVSLRVLSVHPLSFKLINPNDVKASRTSKKSSSFDVSV